MKRLQFATSRRSYELEARLTASREAARREDELRAALRFLSPPIDISPSLHTDNILVSFSREFVKLENFCVLSLEGELSRLDVAMVEASLAKGSSDPRFLLTHRKVTDEVQAKHFDNNC